MGRFQIETKNRKFYFLFCFVFQSENEIQNLNFVELHVSTRLAYNLYFFPEIFETRQRDMKKK